MFEQGVFEQASVNHGYLNKFHPARGKLLTGAETAIARPLTSFKWFISLKSLISLEGLEALEGSSDLKGRAKRPTGLNGVKLLDPPKLNMCTTSLVLKVFKAFCNLLSGKLF